MRENWRPKQFLIVRLALWSLVSLWLVLVAAGFIAQAWRGTLPVDYRTCQSAADALENNSSPYLPPEAAQRVWLSLRQLQQASRPKSTHAHK